MTLDAAIRGGARRLSSSPTAMLDARVLAKAAFRLDDVRLITDGGRAVAAGARAVFDAMIDRRANGEPVAHIIGRREFWSLDIEVAPRILVPRADSEALIEAVVRRRDEEAPLAILDLGCGSGALLCALLASFPNATGLGVDINQDAVALTARNLDRLGLAARSAFLESDWFDAVDARFDVIVSNPPYVRTGDRDILPREVRDFEDARALFAGADGLDAYRAILAEAPARVAPGGLVVLELGDGQAGPVNEIARTAFPKASTAVVADMAGRPRAFVIDLSHG